MSGRQVAVARAPVKIQSESWDQEILGGFTEDFCVRKLITERSITKREFESEKHIWKCFRPSRFKCTPAIRPFVDRTDV